jgi:hypothetical protein
MNRKAVIKVLREVEPTPDVCLRFKREAQVTAAIHDPHVVTVYDYDDAGGYPWIAYEYCPGSSLADRVTAGVLPPNEVALIGWQMAGALEALGRVGVLHRDIKPANILHTGENLYKLADFGVAKWMAPDGVRTATGDLVGTIGFLSPELLEGAGPSLQSDIYALGITMYTCLAGADSRLRSAPRRKMDLAGGVAAPAPLLAVLRRCVEERPEDRYQAAAHLQEDLEKIVLRNDPVPPQPVPHPGSKTHTAAASGGTITVAHSPRRRQRWAGAAAGVFGAVLFASVLLWSQLKSRAEKRLESDQPGARRHIVLPQRLESLWEPVWDQLAALKAGGPAMKQAVRLLANRMPFGLATPEEWIYYLELSRWLFRPNGGPPPVSPVAGGMLDTADLAVYVRPLSLLPGDSPIPRLVPTAFRLVTHFSPDGRSWLLLGHALELDGCEPQARWAYRFALERMNSSQMRGMYSEIWQAYVGARLSVDGDRFERDWHSWAENPEDLQLLIQALQVRFCQSEPDRLERLLEGALEKTRFPTVVSHQLGEFLRVCRQDLLRAEKCWVAGLARDPTSELLGAALVDFHLSRGDVVRARAILARVPGKKLLVRARKLPYVETGKMPVVEMAANEQAFASMEMRRMTDGGGAFVRAINTSYGTPSGAQLFYSWLACGGSLEGVSRPALDALLHRPVPPLLLIAAGDLSMDSTGQFELMLSRVVAPPQRKAPEINLARALWLSRSKRVLAALDLIDAAGPEDLPPQHAPSLCEIISRAAVSPEALPATQKDRWGNLFRAFRIMGKHRKFLKSLMRSDEIEAAKIAEELFLFDPDQPVWGLVQVWSRIRSGDKNGVRDWIARLRAAYRFHSINLWVLRELETLEALSKTN